MAVHGPASVRARFTTGAVAGVGGVLRPRQEAASGGWMTAGRCGPTVRSVVGAGSERRTGVGGSWPDVVLALAVGVIQVVGATHFAGSHEAHSRQVDGFGLILLVATPLALVVRRRWPVHVYAVAFAATVTYQAFGYVAGPEWLGLIVAFVTVMLAGYPRTAVVVLFAAYVWSQWLPPLAGTGHAPSLGLALGVPAWLLVLVGAAGWLRLRRLRAAESARLRQEEVRRRVSEERLGIARELHDVLAQNISLINVQAATTLFQLNGADDRAVRAGLATIKEVSHETLLALRSVLGALRDGGDAPEAPAPSISRLDDLVGRVAALGVIARVEQRGAARPLPPGVDLAAYRILQEALTNVARHAATTTARAEVAYGDADLVVRVDDDGRCVPRSSPGPAIAGHDRARHRARRRLQAGPRPGGGFRVPRPAAPRRGGMIRVLLADDQALVRAGFASLLATQADIEVVGEAADGEQAVRQADGSGARRRPHGHPDAGRGRPRRHQGDRGRRPARRCAGRDPDDLRSRRLCVRGHLQRRQRVPGQGHRARGAASGRCGWSPPGRAAVARRDPPLIAEFASRARAAPAPHLDHLTEREREITALVAEGLSNDEIAARLYLSPATAKTHVNRAMTKLGARDRAQLVVFAYQSGLVRPGWSG